MDFFFPINCFFFSTDPARLYIQFVSGGILIWRHPIPCYFFFSSLAAMMHIQTVSLQIKNSLHEICSVKLDPKRLRGAVCGAEQDTRRSPTPTLSALPTWGSDCDRLRPSFWTVRSGSIDFVVGGGEELLLDVFNPLLGSHQAYPQRTLTGRLKKRAGFKKNVNLLLQR